jgi:hypothetical protein
MACNFVVACHEKNAIHDSEKKKEHFSLYDDMAHHSTSH